MAINGQPGRVFSPRKPDAAGPAGWLLNNTVVTLVKDSKSRLFSYI
jgi:hypothetical protein